MTADQSHQPSGTTPTRSRLKHHHRAYLIRVLALFCTCWLSVGSHYASYVLGPLKSRLQRELGASHTEWSLILSALSLNSTWTPLVGGLLAGTLGTTFTSILATGVVFLGTLFLLLGDIWGNLRLMVAGMFIFGLGVSPLAVVQETIIVRFFKSHGLGVSMAFGLVAGKGASFVSARTSYPLTERFGPRAPFYVATFLAAMSVVINLAYIIASRWLIDGAGAELEAIDINEEAQRRSVINLSEAQALEKVAAKRRVKLREITKLGDVFWACVHCGQILCGTIWAPFTHLAANIIELRYQMTERDAANTASYVLVGSIFLYPMCGYLVDHFKRKAIVIILLILSSTLTMSAYTWLALPPSLTHTAKPAIASFGFGHGFSPLLLVLLVPKIVPTKFISTALGAHKSLEQTGATIFQTLSGLAMDKAKKNPGASSTQGLINTFVFLNLLQLLSIFGVAYLQRRKERTSRIQRRSSSVSFAHPGLPASSDPSRPLLEAPEPHRRYSSTGSRIQPPLESDISKREVRHGEVFAAMSASLIVFAWVLFLGTAWLKLGMKKH
ncbi:major facilitator superfamily domain-containing protein [Mycena sp. CBHHK59/15]|nr:major facilitator superfamily domain-containing protein [Mycena sp. CBHHK59/15]